MFAYSQPYRAHNLTPPSPYTTGFIASDPVQVGPHDMNGVSGLQLKKEYHAKAFRDYQEALQTHNRIPETQSILWASVSPKLANPSVPPPSMG